MLKSSLRDYSDAYILVCRTIKVAPQAGDNRNNVVKKVAFKICAPFTDCKSEINNTQIHNAIDIDSVMCHLIEYFYNYSKKIRKFMAVL